MEDWTWQHTLNHREEQAMLRRQEWMSFVARLEIGWYASWAAVLAGVVDTTIPEPPRIKPEPEPEPPPILSLTDNLVAYWKLDEDSGSRFDSSGNGNTMMEVGVTIPSTSGKIGKAVDYTPVAASYLSCSPSSTLDAGDVDFTLSCWVKFKDMADGEIYSKISDHTEWSIGKASGKLYFWFGLWEDPWTGGGADDTTTLTVGQWYFVVAEHDSVNDLCRISVNGSNFITNPTGGAAPIVAGDAIICGAAPALHDEHGYWKRCLSQAEVTQLYNGGAGLTYPFI